MTLTSKNNVSIFTRDKKRKSYKSSFQQKWKEENGKKAPGRRRMTWRWWRRTSCWGRVAQVGRAARDLDLLGNWNDTAEVDQPLTNMTHKIWQSIRNYEIFLWQLLFLLMFCSTGPGSTCCWAEAACSPGKPFGSEWNLATIFTTTNIFSVRCLISFIVYFQFFRRPIPQYGSVCGRDKADFADVWPNLIKLHSQQRTCGELSNQNFIAFSCPTFARLSHTTLH